MMNSVKLTDLHWVAGFLEGEASFSKCGGTITVQAAQVEKQPVDKLHELCGGRINYFERDNPKWKNYYRWAVYGEEAEIVMKAIHPIMSPRRQARIEELLAWYSTRPGRNFQKSGRKTCRKQLHDWNDENTFINSHGSRSCLVCTRITKNEWQKKNRLQAVLIGGK